MAKSTANSPINKLANHGQALIDTTQDNVVSFFNNLFMRQKFLSRLAERSFNTTAGWMEMLACAVLMMVSFWLSRKLLPPERIRNNKKRNFFLHVLERILWPIIMLFFAIAASYIWRGTGHRVLWLQLLVLATSWMIIIRLVLAVLHAAVPNGRFSDALERGLAGILWVAFVLWLTGMDNAIIKALKSLKIPLGSITLNMYTIITGTISVCAVVILALWVSQLIDNRIMQATRMDLNLRYVLSKIVKSLLVTIAVLVALPMVGIDLTVLSVFGGALGVGLGFGLQKIASTYVSGFIILADRSIRLGDRLTINNFTGYVTKITSRFVVLRNANGSEALVPNDNFIASMVVNESYTSKTLWTSLDVQVAYNTDLPKALAILQTAAANQDRVCTEPPPSSFVVSFGESGINLRVGYWVNDPENGFLVLNSAINLEIWQRFKEVGIEMPFPQQEVRILNNRTDPVYTESTQPVFQASTKTKQTSQEVGTSAKPTLKPKS